MVEIFVAFLTGLTTGGLSCLAVQGGLLATSLTGQIEQDLRQVSANPKKRKAAAAGAQVRPAKPILAFLIAKLAAYTLMGFVLGLVGQMFQLSPYARAFLQIAIGIFMLGNALRLLNVHPIFRYFVIEPPAFLRRRLRKAAAAGDGSSLLAPAFLGLLTVLIPCGITQAMMATALGTGDPLRGAVLMFAFTLGTSPVFFAVAYFATRLGARMEKYFMRFAAVVILVFALVTIDSGLNLAGSPVSVTRLAGSLFPATVQAESAAALTEFGPETSALGAGSSSETAETSADGVVTIDVKNNGYSPNVVHAKSGVPVTLRLVTNKVYSCSRAFTIPQLGVEELLAESGETLVEIPAQQAGTRMPFSCSMGMYTGTIIFDS